MMTRPMRCLLLVAGAAGLLVGLAGCQQDTPLVTIAPASTVPPAETRPVGETAGVMPTATPNPTPTVAPTAAVHAPLSCSDTETMTPVDPELGIPGVIMRLRTLAGASTSEVTFIGGSPLQEKVITRPVEWGNTEEISPDGRWIMYKAYEGDVYLVSSDGEQIHYTLPPPPVAFPEGATYDGWVNANWINDDYVVVNVRAFFDDRTMSPPLTSAILDPFTGTWEPSFTANLPGNLNETPIHFSPDLTRAVYMSGNSSSQVLWDLENRIELWRSEQFAYDYRPIWSPDSIHFIITHSNPAGQTSYLVSRSGESVQIDGIPFYSLLAYGVISPWSPDGQYVALPIPAGERGFDVALYHVTEGEVRILCTGFESRYQDPELTWSFDSNYVALFVETGEERLLVAANIATGEIIRIAGDQTPTIFGWIENEAWLPP